MKTIAISGEARQDLGKKSNKALRREDKVPCVMYGGEENIHFATTAKSLRPLFKSPQFIVAEIDINGTVHRGFVKDYQEHPVKDNILHVDFQELVAEKPVVTSVPVKLEGLAAGVKGGGKLILKQRRLKVRATPDHLVSEIKVNVTDLELNKSIRVSDIELEGAEIINSPSIPVASVEITRALRAAQSAEDKPDATADDSDEGEGADDNE